MATRRPNPSRVGVHVKKSLQVGQTTIEVGLQEIRDIDADPEYLPAERAAIFDQLSKEVDELIQVARRARRAPPELEREPEPGRERPPAPAPDIAPLPEQAPLSPEQARVRLEQLKRAFSTGSADGVPRPGARPGGLGETMGRLAGGLEQNDDPEHRARVERELAMHGARFRALHGGDAE